MKNKNKVSAQKRQENIEIQIQKTIHQLSMSLLT